MNIVNKYIPAPTVKYPSDVLVVTATSALVDKLEFITYPR
jgi:hypothetical protein